MKARIYNDTWWVLCADEKILKDIVETILKESGFTVINFVDHRFSPYGYTALWLLAESHAAIHTFPEENRSYIELSSCVDKLLHDFKSKFNYVINENKWRI